MRRVISYKVLMISIYCIAFYVMLSLFSSVIKSFGDCNQEYHIEKYVKANWFCPIEDTSTKEFFKNFDKPHHKGNR